MLELWSYGVIADRISPKFDPDVVFVVVVVVAVVAREVGSFLLLRPDHW